MERRIEAITWRMKAAGAFSVKSYNQLRRDARQWIIQAANELRMFRMKRGLPIEGVSLDVIYTPGHTDGMLNFVVGGLGLMGTMSINVLERTRGVCAVSLIWTPARSQTAASSFSTKSRPFCL